MEGLRLTAYQDAKGVWTIGYGHTAGVQRGDHITQYQAEQLLKKDLAIYEKAADKIKGLTSQGRYDAVVDFMYNCGIVAFQSSTLRQYIEGGKKTWECQEQFLKWVYSGKKKLGGLVSRRIWEAARFNDYE